MAPQSKAVANNNIEQTTKICLFIVSSLAYELCDTHLILSACPLASWKALLPLPVSEAHLLLPEEKSF